MATIRIFAPADGRTVHRARVAIRGQVKPANAMVQVLGQVVPVRHGAFRSHVRLRPGSNPIDIVAFQQGIEPAATTITVRRAHPTR
jgi:hypothetical protein